MQATPSQLSLFTIQEAAREGSILHVSKSALLAFRVFSSLAKRTGRGFVRSIQSLLPMLGVSERRAWQLVAELKAAGWISWNPIRGRGQRGIEFAPLVKLPKQTPGRFATQKSARPERSLPLAPRAFSCPESALSIAPSNAKSCTLDRGTPYKTSPVGTEDDNSEGLHLRGAATVLEGTPNELSGEGISLPVAASLLENVVSRREAQELAREAGKKALTVEQIKRVLEAYRGQAGNIRNRGAWLREAIRRGFAPAVPATTHASDLVGSAPVPKIARAAPSEMPIVRPGAELLAQSRIPGLKRIMERRAQG